MYYSHVLLYYLLIFTSYIVYLYIYLFESDPYRLKYRYLIILFANKMNF